MVNRFGRPPFLLRGVLTGAIVLSAGCHYVKRSDFDNEIARVRQDMTAGDQRVAAESARQINAVDAKNEARMSALEQGLKQFETETGARVERIEGALKVQAPVHFGFNQTNIEDDQRPVLDRLSGVIKQYYPDAVVTVEGFTDPKGSVAYNKKLGLRRADEVRDYLVRSGGLSPEQVRSVSYGKEADRLITPGAAGPGEEGRENRRAVIVIDHPDAGKARRNVTQ
jgi:peptidoglycan-associated lipoprotein